MLAVMGVMMGLIGFSLLGGEMSWSGTTELLGGSKARAIALSGRN